jgi:hypothetical protein
MTEPVPEPTPPQTYSDPGANAREVAHKNMIWGWSLLAVFVLLFAATVGIAFVYLWLD